MLHLLAACIAASAVAAPAPQPRRLAIPVTPDEVKFTQDRVVVCLTLYLRERLSRATGVRLIGEEWTGAILHDLTGGRRVLREDDLAGAFAEYLPVDDVLVCGFEENRLVARLLGRGGVRAGSFPWSSRSLKDAVVAAACWLGGQLELPPEDRAALAADRIPDREAFEAFYMAQAVSAPWPMNGGERQLKLLQPFFPQNTNVWLAAQVLRSAAEQARQARREQTFAATAMRMAALALPRVLGTPLENSAEPLLLAKSSSFEAALLRMAEASDEPGMGVALPPTEGGDLPERPGAESPDRPDRTIARRLGALRALGLVRSSRGLQLALEAANHADAAAREAAACALRYDGGAAGLEALERLARAPERRVAFQARFALWKRGQERSGLLPLAREFAAGDDPILGAAAVEALASGATADDAALLAALRRQPEPDTRRAAVGAALRLGLVPPADYAVLLLDADPDVVAAALGRFGAGADAAAVGRATALANNPLDRVAQAARLALRSRRPAGGRAQARFDLSVEHGYVRRLTLDALAVDSAPDAVDLLEEACRNEGPHTRAVALERLASRAPERARRAALQAIGDPYHWVRLHAAALLARGAGSPGEAGLLRAALTNELDDATRLYLADALARAEGRPAPAEPPPAHSMGGARNLAWLCGAGVDSTNSPFDAYYCLQADLTEAARRAHARGKIVLARLSAVPHPGLVLTQSRWEDSFWLSIQSQLTATNLCGLDGVILGEETMTMEPERLWDSGWPLFCRDAGLDPRKIDGRQGNLSASEARAWERWALTAGVGGFNAMYDYLKLRYGKLRPGFVVGTFLPGQGAVTPADKEWKFDLGGVYDYKGCSRIAAYTLVRRHKTVWPDRPVLWLSLGIGGYEMNPVKFSQKVPDAPMVSRADRAYGDAVSAWLAGADTGWFSTWIFVARDFAGGRLSGAQLVAEDLVPGSSALTRAIDYAFKGVAKDEILKRQTAEAPALDAAAQGPGAEEPADFLKEDREAHEAADTDARIARDKERMRRGFLIYGKYVYDNARLFASLPRRAPRPEILVIHPGLSVWSRWSEFSASAEDLLNAYDYLPDINQAPWLDLTRYRLIVTSGLTQSPVSDETIAALSRWVRETPGVLYVRGDLCRLNTNQAATVASHSGVLTNDWPWEEDLTFADTHYALKGKAARGAFEGAAGPSLAVWRKDGFAGAVLFDAEPVTTNGYPETVRRAINALQTEEHVGVFLEGSRRQVVGREGEIEGAAASWGPSERRTRRGVDWLTGEPNPAVGGGRGAAVTGGEFTGKYVASHQGVEVLCDRPIERAERIDGGLRLQCAGLMRSGSETGAVRVEANGGVGLPAVEDAVTWILFGGEEGIASLPLPGTNAVATYVRSRRPVTIVRSD